MSNVRFHPSLKHLVDEIVLKLEGVVPGKMFGYPAYYIKGRLFACVYENVVGLKIPSQRATEFVQYQLVTYFLPRGKRQMKEWVQHGYPTENQFVFLENLILESCTYVQSILQKN